MTGFDFLAPRPAPPPDDTWRWATVVSTSPLMVRLDGDTTSLSVDSTMVDPTTLWEDDRVWCQMFGRRLIIIGRGSGEASPVPAGSIVAFASETAPAGWLACNGQALSRTTYAALFAVIGTTYGAGDGSTTFNVPNLRGRVPVGLDTGQAEFNVMAESGGAKTHTLTTAEMPSHTHTQNSHNHTQNSHSHTQDQHRHSVGGAEEMFLTADGNVAVNGTARTQTAAGSTWNYVYAVDSDNVTISESTYSNYTTATNQATTATNQAATATNQNTGGGGAHNNLQPYVVVNYIIKAR